MRRWYSSSFRIDSDVTILTGWKVRHEIKCGCVERGQYAILGAWIRGYSTFQPAFTWATYYVNESNANPPPLFQSQLDLTLNRLILYIFGLLLLICLISGIGAGLWAQGRHTGTPSRGTLKFVIYLYACFAQCSRE